MIGKFSLICGTITLGLMLPMSTYASCVEFTKEAEAVEGVVPKFGKNRKIRAFVIYSEATFLAPKRSLIGKARRKAELRAKRAFSEFMKQKLNSETIVKDMLEQVERTDQDGNTEGMAEEISSEIDVIRTNTSAVLSGLIKLDECVDRKEKVVMVAVGWKPGLSKAAADTKQKIAREVKRGGNGSKCFSTGDVKTKTAKEGKRGNSGSKGSSSGNASEGNCRPTSKITPTKGYRKKSKLKDDF